MAKWNRNDDRPSDGLEEAGQARESGWSTVAEWALTLADLALQLLLLPFRILGWIVAAILESLS